MKEQIELDELGVGIDRISKTSEGNLRIKLRERKEGAMNKLKDETINKLGSKVGGAKEIKRKSDTLIIRGTDSVTTKEEIRQAICNTLKLSETDITVHTLKEMQNGLTQVATIGIEKRHAEKMISMQKIKIGWVNCTIRELITPVRCYRCQRYGHLRKDCSQEEINLKGKCHNCLEEGHTLKECKYSLRCHECDLEGHQNGSMACPKYRKAVAEARKAKEATKAKRAENDKVGGKINATIVVENTTQANHGRTSQQIVSGSEVKRPNHDN